MTKKETAVMIDGKVVRPFRGYTHPNNDRKSKIFGLFGYGVCIKFYTGSVSGSG